MKLKYFARLTIEVNEEPLDYNDFEAKIESEIESNLESTDYIKSAEILLLPDRE